MSSTRQRWCVTCDATALCDDRGCIACRARQERIRALRTNGPVTLGKFCAICVDGVSGLRAVLFEACGAVYTICQQCDGGDVVSSRPSARTSYAPIDETLERMRVRLLRTLRHFDWTSSDELVVAMGIDEPSERKGYRRALAYSVRRGFVECDRRNDEPWRYRLTPAGRASYAAALERNAA